MNTIRQSLRKNSAVFHKLPNGEYGLLSWYPNAKPIKQEDEKEEPSNGYSKPKASNSDAGPEDSNDSGDYLNNSQIREMVFSLIGEFKATDLEEALKRKYHAVKPRQTAIPTLLYTLTKKGLLRIVSNRRGNIGATYVKA